MLLSESLIANQGAERIRGLKPGEYLIWGNKKPWDGRPVMCGGLSTAASIYFLFKASFATCVCSSTLLMSFYLPVYFCELIVEQKRLLHWYFEKWKYLWFWLRLREEVITNVKRREEKQKDGSYKTSRNVRDHCWKCNSENGRQGGWLATDLKFAVIHDGGRWRMLLNLLRRVFISSMIY